MGRAGSKSSSSGSSPRSGGGHSVSRTGGGHRVGGSTRPAGTGGLSSKTRPAGSRSTPPRSSFGTPPPPRGGFNAPPPPRGGFHAPPPPRGGFHAPPPPRGGFNAPPPPPRHNTVYVNSGGRYRGGTRISGLITSVIVLIVFTAIMYGVVSLMFSGSSDGGSAKSTINRTALTDSAPFVNDCIVDELGWFDREENTERRLQSFYNKTGVQPYIVLHAYDPALTSDAKKEQWAKDYYEANIPNESTFLYVYFAEQDTDGEIGYMYYVNGTMVSSVMDSEAVEIFWNYIDRYWTSDMSTDELFLTVFDQTAETIMHVSTTGFDVAKAALIIGGIIVILLLAFTWWKARARREKEKAAETERILNTPMQDLVNESRADELAKKYDR